MAGPLIAKFNWHHEIALLEIAPSFLVGALLSAVIVSGPCVRKPWTGLKNRRIHK